VRQSSSRGGARRGGRSARVAEAGPGVQPEGSSELARRPCPHPAKGDIRGRWRGRRKDKIERLKEEIVRLNAINAEMMKSEDKQISLTDPDARSMATSGKDTGIVGYNADCG
jgi:hypothetical protein